MRCNINASPTALSATTASDLPAMNEREVAWVAETNCDPDELTAHSESLPPVKPTSAREPSSVTASAVIWPATELSSDSNATAGDAGNPRRTCSTFESLL